MRGGKGLLPSSFSGHERNRLFLSSEGRQFTDPGGISGLDHDGDSRSFATLDHDRDGWIDFVMVNANAPMVKLYRNQISRTGDTDQGGIVAIKLVGGNESASPSGSWSNRDGIGAHLTLDTGKMQLSREQRAGEGLAAQNSSTMIVGVGADPEVGKLMIRWPSGKSQTVNKVAPGSLVTVYENPEMSPAGEHFVIEPYLPGNQPGRNRPVAEEGTFNPLGSERSSLGIGE